MLPGVPAWLRLLLGLRPPTQLRREDLRHGPSDEELDAGAEYRGGEAPADAPALPCRHCGLPRVGGHTPVTAAGGTRWLCREGPDPQREWEPAV